jgi:hypothetical protein
MTTKRNKRFDLILFKALRRSRMGVGENGHRRCETRSKEIIAGALVNEARSIPMVGLSCLDFRPTDATVVGDVHRPRPYGGESVSVG